MEARQRLEFTGGSRAVATIDQRQHRPDGLRLLEAGGDPFVAPGIVGSTQDMQPHAALRPAPQSPPPLDLWPRSGSGGRNSEVEWGGGTRRAMRASGHILFDLCVSQVLIQGLIHDAQ